VGCWLVFGWFFFVVFFVFFFCVLCFFFFFFFGFSFFVGFGFFGLGGFCYFSLPSFPFQGRAGLTVSLRACSFYFFAEGTLRSSFTRVDLFRRTNSWFWMHPFSLALLVSFPEGLRQVHCFSFFNRECPVRIPEGILFLHPLFVAHPIKTVSIFFLFSPQGRSKSWSSSPDAWPVGWKAPPEMSPLPLVRHMFAFLKFPTSFFPSASFSLW